MSSQIVKEWKFFRLTGQMPALILAKNGIFLLKNEIFQKIFSILVSSLRHQTYVTHLGVLINRIKFRVSTPSNFGGVEA